MTTCSYSGDEGAPINHKSDINHTHIALLRDQGVSAGAGPFQISRAVLTYKAKIELGQTPWQAFYAASDSYDVFFSRQGNCTCQA